MESKRQYQHEGDENVQILARHSKRRREDSQQAETSCIRGILWSVPNIKINDIVSFLEPVIRRVVQEELECLISPTINQNGTCGAKFFKLDFKNDLPATIFTFSKIKSKDDKPVEIALYDVRSNSIVTDGPLSSSKVQICVLDSGFGSNGSEDWTTDQFMAKIIRKRENKGQLLKGDHTVITLQNGVGAITKIQFTDNSRWASNGRFRLGAKVVQSTSKGEDIREGRSNPFKVLFSRGESNKKHDTPSLSDKIWHLKNISKGGKFHQRLSEHGINTVEDLLQLDKTNPSLLQEIFRKNLRKLREAIEHATGVSKVTFHGQSYHTQYYALNCNEKRLEIVEQHADRNVKDLIPVDETPVYSFLSPLASLQSAGQCSAPDLQALDWPTEQQDQLDKRQDFSQPSTSTSHIEVIEAEFNSLVGFTGMFNEEE